MVGMAIGCITSRWWIIYGPVWFWLVEPYWSSNVHGFKLLGIWSCWSGAQSAFQGEYLCNIKARIDARCFGYIYNDFICCLSISFSRKLRKIGKVTVGKSEFY